MWIDKLVKLVGIVVIAAIVIAVPMLSVYSIDHNWNELISTILCILTCFDVIGVACVLTNYIEERSYK